jgi:hypothetical protein
MWRHVLPKRRMIFNGLAALYPRRYNSLRTIETSLFHDTISDSHCVVPDDCITVNTELQVMWMEVVVAKFNVLLLYLVR